MIRTGPHRTLLLLATDFPPSTGGIQTLTWEIYSRLADLTRLAVAPAAPLGPMDPLDNDALPLTRTRRGLAPGWPTLHYLRQAASLIQRQRRPLALLHCNHLFAGFAGWWLRRRWGLPYLVWVHGEELTKCRYPRLARASLTSAAAICCNSAFTADQVRRCLLGRRLPPLHQVVLGASRAWRTAPPRAHPGLLPTILTVARLAQRHRYKGVDTALAAMALLRDRGHAFRYQIAGDGDDRGYLQALARQLDLADRVEFLGRLPDNDLMAAYDRCDIFLLCSREQPTPRGLGFEGFGIALLEANARGKPVVGGRSGGITTAVVADVTGLLADPDSAEAVAGALERLLDDPALRARLGAQGRARVEREYNWEHAADQVRALHGQLLPGGRA
ncbi:MAG: glycosyltransferase family 4 protein [Terriglobales bacterium]